MSQSTFNLIIEKVINNKNNIFSLNYNKTDKVESVFKWVFNILSTGVIMIMNEHKEEKDLILYKFAFFYDMLSNLFLKNRTKEFIDYFCKIQKTYWALNRFAHICKYKRSQIVVNTDMGLNEISINNKNTICIFQDDARYLFNINDIIKIIHTSLTNADNFFSKPLCIKNPYNNIPFDKSILYYIYFFIKYKTFHNSELFTRFFKYHFNLTIFAKRNEYLLREYAINNFVYTSSTNTLANEIYIMIDEFNSYCRYNRLKHKIKIDKEFPEKLLVEIMRPYLLIFCISNYAFIYYEKQEAQQLLKKLLIVFSMYNPVFGRKKYKINITHDNRFKKRLRSKTIEFDDRHLPFNNVRLQNAEFLQDHLHYMDTRFINDSPVINTHIRFIYI